jgi:FKBP-type peptidyl-prolyl cis-trans isomerase FkpA
MKKYILLLIIPFAIFSCKKKEISAEEQARIDKAIILKYISDNSLVADSSSTGLYYIISDTGSVQHPHDSSLISIYYKGFLTDGTLFDQNGAGQPVSFFLYKLIQGWREGIPKIGKNGKIKLLIPSALGYGTQETPTNLATIPANSVLIFDIELSNFQ